MNVNTIHNENCLLTMNKMPDNFIDLIVTSPPYDKLRSYNGYSFDFVNIAKEMFRIIKENGVIVWIIGDSTVNGSETGTSFKQALYFMEIGFKLHDTMIYAKKNFIPQNHKRYEQAFEYIFVLVKGKIKTFNPLLEKTKLAGQTYNLKRNGYSRQIKEASQRRRDKKITVKPFKIVKNIFTYHCGNSGKNHPAVFPLQLAKDQIYSWSNEFDLVYDPFMGSGTTIDACMQLNRAYIGSEISQEYFLEFQKRMENISKQQKLFIC